MEILLAYRVNWSSANLCWQRWSWSSNRRCRSNCPIREGKNNYTDSIHPCWLPFDPWKTERIIDFIRRGDKEVRLLHNVLFIRKEWQQLSYNKCKNRCTIARVYKDLPLPSKEVLRTVSKSFILWNFENSSGNNRILFSAFWEDWINLRRNHQCVYLLLLQCNFS